LWRAAPNRLVLLSWLGRICCCILDVRIGDSRERQIEREEKRRNSPSRRKRKRRRRRRKKTTTTTTRVRLLVFVVSRCFILPVNFLHSSGVLFFFPQEDESLDCLYLCEKTQTLKQIRNKLRRDCLFVCCRESQQQQQDDLDEEVVAWRKKISLSRVL
jgi:hypothetical protein